MNQIELPKEPEGDPLDAAIDAAIDEYLNEQAFGTSCPFGLFACRCIGDCIG